MQYTLTYLIDVVSKNPNDFTRTDLIEAENEQGAKRQFAKNRTVKNFHSTVDRMSDAEVEVFIKQMCYSITINQY